MRSRSSWRGHGAQCPACAAAVRVAVGVGTGWARDALRVEVAGDTGDAAAGELLGEHPLHVGCGRRVGLQALCLSAPCGVRVVGMWAGVYEAVAVGRPATEMASLLDDLGVHGCLGPES